MEPSASGAIVGCWRRKYSWENPNKKLLLVCFAFESHPSPCVFTRNEPTAARRRDGLVLGKRRRLHAVLALPGSVWVPPCLFILLSVWRHTLFCQGNRPWPFCWQDANKRLKHGFQSWADVDLDSGFLHAYAVPLRAIPTQDSITFRVNINRTCIILPGWKA